MGKGPGGKGAKGQKSLPDKDLRALMKKHQVQNMSGLIKSLESLGVRFKGSTSNKGKGKGQNPTGRTGGKGQPAGTTNPKAKLNVKARFSGGPAKDNGPRGSGGGGSSWASSSPTRPIITLKGAKDMAATMLDQQGNTQHIQFICHDPGCFLAHYRQRKFCIACRAPRDVDREPQCYDPDVHKARVAKAPPLSALAGASAKAKPGPAKASEAAKAEEESGPAEASTEAGHAAEDGDDDMALEAEEEDQDDLQGWFPSCLTKAAVKLCIHEGSSDVLKYKRHFDISELAESELTQQIELERRRLSVMEVDPQSFLQDISHSKQRIGQLEEKLTKDDTSNQTSGEHHATGGRLQILLGNHLQAVHEEDTEHTAAIAEMEGQIATLKTSISLAELTHARRMAANDALKLELEAKLDPYKGPTYRLQQLRTDEATANIQQLMDKGFTQQWLDQAGLGTVVTPELLKVPVARAMTVAQQAQTQGIRITPPVGAAGSSVVPGLAQPAAQLAMDLPSSQGTATTAFGPASLQALQAGGQVATKSATPYARSSAQ
jgi:hypothetical protein